MKKITFSDFSNLFTKRDIVFESGFKFNFSKEKPNEANSNNLSSRSGVNSLLLLLALFLFSNFLSAKIITVDGNTADWSVNYNTNCIVNLQISNITVGTSAGKRGTLAINSIPCRPASPSSAPTFNLTITISGYTGAANNLSLRIRNNNTCALPNDIAQTIAGNGTYIFTQANFVAGFDPHTTGMCILAFENGGNPGGMGGGTMTASLNITYPSAPALQDYTVGCVNNTCDSEITACLGQPAMIATFGITAINGLTEDINVSLVGAPAGMTISDFQSSNFIQSPYPDFKDFYASLSQPIAPGSYTYSIVFTSVPSVITHSYTVTTTFTAPVVVSCGGPYASLCIDSPAIPLNASTDGYWSGAGVDGNTFNPAVAGVGTHTLYFNSFDFNACDAQCETTITVNQQYPFYVDNDVDSYGAGPAVYLCSENATTVPSGYSLNNTDCNDANNSIWRTGDFYTDGDGDNYTVGPVQSFCYGASLPAGYSTNSLGTDCNDLVAAINPGHVEVLYNGIDDNCDGQLDEGFQLTSSLQSVSCGATLSAMGSLVYTDINLSATAYRFKVVNNTTGDIQYVDNTHQWFALNWMSTYDYSTAYTVSVQLQIAGVWVGYYGTTCVVNSPDITSSTGTLQLVSSQCGATSPSIATVIYTTAQAGATGYRFRITDVTVGATGANLVQVKERSYHWFTLPMLSRYNYGSTYMIEVAVKTTGGYTGYGSPCYVNTPASPMLNSCGAVIPTSRTLVYTAITKSVTQYRFQVTRVSDQSARTFDTSRFWFSFKVNMPGYTPSVAYSVRVAVMTAGTWSPFGDACEITSPAIPRTDINAEFDFTATVFPNPYSDQFNLLVNTDSDERISFRVYDMLGKLIEAEEFDFTALETKEFGRNYPAGVYNIIVSQGENVKTLRVIKR